MYDSKKKQTKLKAWVLSTGMKQNALAKEWGICVNHASHIISGVFLPDMRRLKYICDSTKGKVTPRDVFLDYRNVTVDKLMELEKIYCANDGSDSNEKSPQA